MSFEDLINGTLGNWNTDPEDLIIIIIIKYKDTKPCHNHKISVPQIHYSTLKKELDKLVEIGVLENNSDSPWSSPTLFILKKNGTVRFISNFRILHEKNSAETLPSRKNRRYNTIITRFQNCYFIRS